MIEKENISIIIPTHCRHNQLRRLLNSLISQTDIIPLIEIVVISNMYDRNIIEICSSYSSSVNILSSFTNRIGVNFARNLGIKLANNDFCFFVDDDCVFENDQWFECIVESFSDPQVVGVGGYYKPLQPMTHAGALYYSQITSWLVRYRDSQNNSKEALRMVGGCMALRKSKLEGLLFDEKIKFGGAETSLILKLNQMNKKLILDSRITLLHDFDISELQYFKKSFQQWKFHFSMPEPEHRVFANQKRSFKEIHQILIQNLVRKGYSKIYLNTLLLLSNLAFNITRLTFKIRKKLCYLIKFIETIFF